MSSPRQLIVATFVARVMDLGAKIRGAETCYLGAIVHGAELRVYFLKSFQKGCTCENLSTKGLKNKKVGGPVLMCVSCGRVPDQY
jgi:hypothetical protein